MMWTFVKVMLRPSHRESPRWATAGGIPCSSCHHCSKRVRPAPSCRPTILTVWGWVHQARSTAWIWLRWGLITAEPSSHRVSCHSEDWMECFGRNNSWGRCFSCPTCRDTGVNHIEIMIIPSSSRPVSELPALLPAQRVWESSVCAAGYDGARWALWVSRIFPGSYYVFSFA